MLPIPFMCKLLSNIIRLVNSMSYDTKREVLWGLVNNLPSMSSFLESSSSGLMLHQDMYRLYNELLLTKP